MKDIYYINSNNEKIDLLEPPYMMQTGEIFDVKWVYDSKSSASGGSKISSLRKNLEERAVTLSIINFGKESYELAVNRFHEITDIDVIRKSPGRLYVGDMYINCYVTESKKSNWESESEFMDVDLIIAVEYPFWIREHNIQILPKGVEQSSSGMDFPFDFPFDFSPRQSGVATREINHYTSSHFKMRFYGPCVDPVVKINGYPYQIYTVLKSGEYLEIDSRNHFVTKYMEDGSTDDLYNSRSFDYSVFEKIPSGVLKFVWDGSFGIDLKLYLERSEPKW